MAHLNNTKKSRKGKQLNYEERIKIEALSKTGMKSEQIAQHIGCSGRTIRRELAKGLKCIIVFFNRQVYLSTSI